MDLRGVVGNCTLPSTLREAGAEDADLLIACAPLDETNLVACKLAHDLFNIPTTIARIRSPEFVDGSALMQRSGFAVDEVICPEESLTRYIRKLVEYPEALQVVEFAEGKVSLIAVRAITGGPMVGHIISELPQLVTSTCASSPSTAPASEAKISRCCATAARASSRATRFSCSRPPLTSAACSMPCAGATSPSSA